MTKPLQRRSKFFGGAIRLLIVCVLLAGAYGIWIAVNRTQSRQNTARQDLPPAPVQVAAAAHSKVPIYTIGLGSVQAYNTVTVRSRVDGEIQKIAFEEGQMVKEGDLLVQIDPRPFQAMLDQAVAKKAQDEAQLANAKLDLARYNELATRSFASKQQVDTQQAAVNQFTAQIQGDQAQIDNARTELGYTTIRSPIAGRTGLRLVDQGNIVRSTDSGGIVTVAQIQPISVLYTLPEQSLPALQKAQAAGPVTVQALAQGSKSVLAQGTLTLINNEIDQESGTIKLKATFENKDRALWPGQSVTMRTLLETLDALTVPADAIQRTQQGLAVYVVRPDDTAEFRRVDVGPITQGLAVIESGLSEGDQVVTSGQYRLQPGTKIRKTEGQPPQAPGPAGNAKTQSVSTE
ncbi:efflux RND transporter periplasmic adaptor subunit [Microvirga sp. TS319]|uniref:efflux RND transporter periplasmic adaptor subunit n=1 Tax=Microvirga sp. TS319 TaxID=3241165 RepID=UPI00351A4CCA